MSTTTAAPRVRPSTRVTTTLGAVRGRETEHARVFLGIPYAAAPRGPGRFAAPAPHEPWAEERDAREPGPTAPQPFRGRIGELDLSPFFGAGWTRGDDHLTVNVWAPLVATSAPVIVFVHGGAFLAGSPNAPAYDGSAFAREGVVFVSVSYRLGITGFLHLPDAPDNRGTLDVIAALRWIRDDIAAFGGDPGNVTLMGQSAGGILVSSVLGDPAAEGLFRRAIVQSGSGTGAFTTEQARLVTSAVSDALGVDATAASLGGLDDAALVDLLPALAGLDLTTADAHDPLGGITPFSLVLDEQPADSVLRIGARAGARLPDLLIGSNADESALYVAPFRRPAETTAEEVLAAAAKFDRDPAARVERYRAAAPAATDAELRVAVLSDGMFRTGTRLLAEAHARSASTTFAYEFVWRSDALESGLGASHLMELPFVFDAVGIQELHGPQAMLGTAPAPAGLASAMHAAWIRFATTGSPGWAAHTVEQPTVQVFGEDAIGTAPVNR